MKLLILLIIIVIIYYSCSSVAYTKRKQLNLVPNSELVTMSATQYKQVVSEAKLSTNMKQVALIKKVGYKIQKAVERYMASQNRTGDLTGYEWEFNLLDDPKTLNAWCMPGGKVAFYTGILPICQDEQGIAVVMGHEIAHAIANHGRERMSQSMLTQLGLSALSSSLQGVQYGPYLMQAVGIGTNLGMLKFSRNHESEADHLGLIFMTMAGYNPSEAPKFWKRMAKMGESGQMEFLSTHPSHETRISDLKGWIPEARAVTSK